MAVSQRHLYEMAASLLMSSARGDPFSRNKHFDAHNDPRFRRAIALYRRLRALAADLERARHDGSTLVIIEETKAGRPSVRLEIVGPRARRTAWLDKAAWEVLLVHPGARAAVAALRDRVAA